LKVDVFGCGSWLAYGARFYDPSIGRFTSIDALADHPNQVDKSVYAYAWNNPISLTDPDGNCPTCPPEVNAFGYGVFKGIGSAIKSTINAIAHPIETGKAFLRSGTTAGQVEILTNLALETQEFVDAPGIVKAYKAGVVTGEVGAGIAAEKGLGALGKISKLAKATPDGVVYRRSDLTGELDVYIGQAKNEGRFNARQKEHARANPDSDFGFEIIDRADPSGSFPTKLDKAEQRALDAHGGPRNKSNPDGRTSNKKNVIKKEREY
jgi:RHS repeat-associated protein